MRSFHPLLSLWLILASVLSGCGPSAPVETPQRVPIEIRNDQVIGDLYVPDGTGPFVGVVVIGGSEGGLSASGRLASALADAGFAALAVAYFGVETLPPQLVSIPLERFDLAIDWLRAQPQVRPDAVALLGVSKGAEAALLVASARSDLRAVIAATPTHVSWQGLDMAGWSKVPSFTRAAAEVPYVPYNNEGSPWPLVEMYARSLRDEQAVRAARIPVEQIQAPLLLISGEQDQIWPAFAMATQISNSLRSARADAVIEHLSYPNAGHALIGMPFDPNGPKVQALLQLGGSIEGNLEARRDNWPKIIQFLRGHAVQ